MSNRTLLTQADRRLLRDAAEAVLSQPGHADLLAEYTREGWGHERFVRDILHEAVRQGHLDIESLYARGLNDGQMLRALIRVTQDPLGYRARVAAGTRRKDLKT